MTMPWPAISGAPPAFLGVKRSVCGRVWRDRLDERATARALSMTQRHGVSELLARVLAGRGVEVDQVEEFLDPTVRRLMPDPDTLSDMPKAAARLADAIDYWQGTGVAAASRQLAELETSGEYMAFISERLGLFSAESLPKGIGRTAALSSRQVVFDTTVFRLFDDPKAAMLQAASQMFDEAFSNS